MMDEELIGAHFVHLCNVLDVLRKLQLRCNGAKAVLFATQVEFAGQVVGHGIRRPIPGRLRCLTDWERPENITEMTAFLGFCNYYSAYVHMYAEPAAPVMVSRSSSAPSARVAITLQSANTYEASRCQLL